MLWTLWRAILIDFFRLLLLATAVLVTVVAFAATVQPLADGKLTTDQAIRFMVYAIPPMLAYALPFAAGFAATLTYHRFAAENEITAAHAGGVSHFKLLVPAILSGLLLGGVLWGLNDRVIPRFLTRMEEMITRDFARIMVASLKQGKSATIGDTEIHADQV
jgi:lipopolysaccharide export LptBFGC system permease protein LptF